MAVNLNLSLALRRWQLDCCQVSCLLPPQGRNYVIRLVRQLFCLSVCLCAGLLQKWLADFIETCVIIGRSDRKNW